MRSAFRCAPLLAALAFAPALAGAENRIDTIRADAPELAAYGTHAVGVRRLDLVHEDQIDIAAVEDITTPPDAQPRADRPLPVEIWYPAAPGAEGSTTLRAFIRDGKTEVGLEGRAVFDAAPETGTAFPLVIVSHGYPGNRFLMAPLAESLASKGYVVAAIDHTDTTYSTLRSFPSALANRSRDQLFVLDELARMAAEPGSFLHGLADPDQSAIIGYSMGGYGALVSAGAGLTEAAVTAREGMWSAPAGSLDLFRAGSEAYAAHLDPRVKTVIAFAPAGYSVGFFDNETLAGIRIPVLFIGGSRDDVVGYEGGVRATWEAAVNSDRALLTFENANHNVGAPMAPPEEARRYDEALGFNMALHYMDFVWDNVRMNNVSAHFAAAWLGKYLKGDSGMDAYLDLVPDSADGVRPKDGSGADTYWTGFPDRSAQGLRFETLAAAAR
ncbi:dienelactone hydrolase [Poseidonocella sp. HB161398]|uniref:alpha/beta hydrolase family protein n=1 Tax=Poseidonocella sp. HB161398 TaxID=2320855 RepID=UPI0011085CFF|nr:dienelactone hydrolase [Poseidonocella sp. HB161398]